VIVTTPRLVLRPFTDMDRAPLHALNTNTAVVESQSGADADGDFDLPALPGDSPLRRQVLSGIGASQLPPTVAA
jgi:hypothetical protein